MSAQSQPRRLSTAPWDSGEFRIEGLTREAARPRRVRARTEQRDAVPEAELEWVDLSALLED